MWRKFKRLTPSSWKRGQYQKGIYYCSWPGPETSKRSRVFFLPTHICVFFCGYFYSSPHTLLCLLLSDFKAAKRGFQVNLYCTQILCCWRHTLANVTKTEGLMCVAWPAILATDPEARVQFLALPEKKSSGSGTGSTQPREYNWGATW
jgi:hypothetical protein